MEYDGDSEKGMVMAARDSSPTLDEESVWLSAGAMGCVVSIDMFDKMAACPRRSRSHGFVAGCWGLCGRWQT